MEDNEFNKVHIKSSYYFDGIIKLEDFALDNILIDKKSHENILMYDISYKNLVDSKPLHIRSNKIDGFLEFMMELDI